MTLDAHDHNRSALEQAVDFVDLADVEPPSRDQVRVLACQPLSPAQVPAGNGDTYTALGKCQRHDTADRAVSADDHDRIMGRLRHRVGS